MRENLPLHIIQIHRLLKALSLLEFQRKSLAMTERVKHSISIDRLRQFK